MKFAKGLLTGRTAAVVAVVGVVGLAAGTGATAASIVTGAQVKDGTITGRDIKDGSVWSRDLAPWVSKQYTITHDNSVTSKSVVDGSLEARDLSAAAKQSLKGNTGAQGEKGATGAQGEKGAAGKDGAPGLSGLIAGSGYNTTWQGDSGATLQTAREECPEGQYAIGGGFSTWGGDKDLGGDNKNIQITVSAPYFEGDYKPVDEAGNFRPTEWVVKGYNNGTSDQIVRAWVTCANVAD